MAGKHSTGIRKHLIRSVILYVLLPLFAIIALLSVQVCVYMNRQTIINNETFLSQIAINADQMIEIVNYATSKLMLNQSVLNDLRTINALNSESYSWYTALNRVGSQVENIESSIMNAMGGKLFLLSSDDYIIHYTYMAKAKKDYTAQDWYSAAVENARVPVYAPEIREVFAENPGYHTLKDNYGDLYYARVIRSYSGEDLGMVLVQISGDKIWRNFLDSSPVKNTDLYLIDSNGEIQMCTEGAESYRFFTDTGIFSELSSGEKISGSLGNDYDYSGIRLSNSNNTLLCIQPHRALFSANHAVMTTIIGSVLVLTIVILLIFIVLANRITRPITSMARQMNAHPENPLQSLDAHSRFMELNRLAESYNDAQNRVRQLLDQVRDETRLREEAYYEMLMSQISPHFICNTVNSIRFLAENDHAARAAEALYALGDILQFVYSHKSDVTIIAREMQLLSSYVKIMRMRFNDSFQYIEDIPLDFYMCEIPTFTLQPLVENAILHGVLDKHAGQIVVSAQANEKQIDISVFNNSRCDDIQKVLNCLNQESRNRSQFTGVGLYNIDKRLKILYGQNYGLTIDHTQEFGFEVIVHLPRKEGTLS